jgi:CBS domain containing-hemolysin-like protein
MDPDYRALLGTVHSGQMDKSRDRRQGSRSLAEIMRPVADLPVVDLDTSLAEVMDKLTQASSRVAAVYDGSFFQGLISVDDVSRVFQILSRRTAGGSGPGWEANNQPMPG